MNDDRVFTASLEQRIEELQNRVDRAYAAGDTSLATHLSKELDWLESQLGG